jgi:hypothetical protein
MLIGLTGRAQAGKDTVFERLVLLYRTTTEVRRVSFADPLYESAAAALGVDVEFLRRWKADPRAGLKLAVPGVECAGSLTFREYLQRYGTEAHRTLFGPDFWVERADLTHDGRIVVVTDVRFRNEAQAIADAGGAVVRVTGPAEVEGVEDAHQSEAGIPAYLVDQTLDNSVRGDNFRALNFQLRALVARLLRDNGGKP